MNKIWPFNLLRNFVLAWAATVFIKHLDDLIDSECGIWRGDRKSFSMSARQLVKGDLQIYRGRRGARYFLKPIKLLVKYTDKWSNE